MTDILLALIAVLLAMILYAIFRVRKENGKQFDAFKKELKGYLTDMYAQMIKKD